MLNDFDLTFDPQNLDSSAVLSINYLRRLTNTSDTGLESEYESGNDAVSLYDLKTKSKLYKSGKVRMDTSVFRYDIIGTNSAPNYETLDDGFRYGDVSVSSTNEDDFPYDLYTPVEYIQVGFRNGGITIQNILPIYSKECRFEGDVYFPSNWSIGPNGVARAVNNTSNGNKLLSFMLPYTNASGMNPFFPVHHPVIGILRSGHIIVNDPNTTTKINDTTSVDMTDYFGKKIHIVGSVSKAAAVWNSTDQRVEEVADKDLIPTWTGSNGPGSNSNELHTLKYYFSVQSYEYIDLGSGNGYRRQKPDVLVYYPLKTPCKTFDNQLYFVNHIEGESVNNYSGPTTLAENLQNDSSIVAYATSNRKLPRWNNRPNTADAAKYVMQDRMERNAVTALNDQLAARWGLFGMSYSDLPYPRLNSQNRYFGGCHNLGDFFHAYLDNGGMNHYFNQETTYPGHGYFLATAFTNTWGETSTRYMITNSDNKPSPPSTRIYSGFKLWQDYDLVGDFVTCKRNSDGLYGVYNKIDKVFSCSEYDEWVSQNRRWPWHFTLEGETPGYTIPAIWGDGSLGGYDTYYNTIQATGWDNKPYGGLEYNDNSYDQTNFEYNNYSIAGPVRENGSGNDKAIAYVRIDGTEPVFGKPVTEGVYFDFDHRTLKWNFPSKDNPLKFRVWIDPSVNRNIHASQSQLWKNTDTMLFGATGTTRPQRWDTEWPTGEEPSLVSIDNLNFASYIHRPSSSLVTNLPIYNRASVVTSGSNKKEGISLVQTTPYYDVSLYFPDPSLNGVCGTDTGILALTVHDYTNIATHLSTTVTDNSVFDRYYNQIVFVGDTMSPDSGASSMVTWDKGDGYVRPDYLDYTETPTNRWNSVPVRGYIQHNVRNHSGISVEPDHVSIWPDEYAEINTVSFTWDGEPNPRWNECLWNIRIKDLNEGSYRHKYVYDEFYKGTSHGAPMVVPLWSPSYDATYENQKPAMGYQIRGILNYLRDHSLKPAFGTDICLSEYGPQDWLDNLSHLNGYNNYPTFYRTCTDATIGTEPALFYRLCGQRIIPIIDASEGNEYLNSNILLTNNGTNSPGAINPWEYIWNQEDYIISEDDDLPVLKWPLFMRETPDSSDLNKAKMLEDLDENWTVENLAPFYYDLPDSSYPLPRKMAGKSWQYEFSKEGWVLGSAIFTGEIKNPIAALHLMDSSLWKQTHIDLWNADGNDGPHGLLYYNGTNLSYGISHIDSLPSDNPEHLKGLIAGIEIQGWNPDEPVYSTNLTAVSSDPDAVTVSLLNSQTAALWGLDDSQSGIGDADLLSSQNEMISAWPDNHQYAVSGFTGSGVQLQYYIVEFLKDQCNCTVTWSNNDGHNNGSVSCNLDVSISRPINTTGSIDIYGDNTAESQSKRYAVYDPYECTAELLDASLNALDTLRINVQPDSIANTVWDNFTLIDSTDNLAEWSIDSSAYLNNEATVLKIIPNRNAGLSLDSWYKIKYIRVSINPSVLQIPYSDSSTYLGKTGNIITFAGAHDGTGSQHTWSDPLPEGRLSSGLFNWFSSGTIDNLTNSRLLISFIKGHSPH